MPTKLNHQSGVLRVCVDRVEGTQASGRVYSQRLSAPMPFADLGGLLLQLEELLERQNFPQAFQRIRSFASRGAEYPDGLAPEGAMTAEDVAGQVGERATFVLSILTRMNATWQGTVDWLDGSAPAPFSSDLEFLNLVETRMARLP